MSLRQSLIGYTPPKFIHWAKRLVNADYRHKSRELARIKSIPRWQSFFTNILGREVEAVDSASFISMYTEIFEKEIYRFRGRSENPLIIDCGSNIGLSVIYFKRLYPQARIVSFEADEEICAVLQRNIERMGYPNVEMHCRAVWSKQTKLAFRSEGADGGRLAQGDDSHDQTVAAVRLRDYLDEPVDLLKLDIEGAETEVLRDCWDSLEKVDNIFVEYHSFATEQQTLHALLTILANAGFRVHVQPENVSPRPFIERSINADMDLQLNIFAFRPAAT